jgi:hypothetical protein
VRATRYGADFPLDNSRAIRLRSRLAVFERQLFIDRHARFIIESARAAFFASGACAYQRTREANDKARRVVRRALIVLLSARDRSARIIENGSCKLTLEPIARGDICHPIPGRPVRVMATAIVRIHRDSRNRRFRVAWHDGGDNSRSMMSNVSRVLTISLGERRSTE